MLGLLLVADIGDGAVDQILGEVVALALRRIDELVVLHQERRPLVGLAAEVAVIFLEAHAERPAVERAGGGIGGVGRQVPLAEGEGVVAVLLQDLGDGGGALGDAAETRREAGGAFANRGEADRMVIAACEKRGARRRAQRRRMKVGIPDTFRR